MTNSDKIGIAVAVGVTVLFVAIVAANPSFKSEIIHDAISVDKEITREISSIKQEVSDDITLLEKKALEMEQEIIEFEKAKKTIQEKLTKNDSQKQMQNTFNEIQISIPKGTSVPGCEETNECYAPSTVNINLEDVVIWTNHDTAAHTVTSGSPYEGQNGVLDSGLILPGDNFEFLFNDSGNYNYFCMVHPWMTGTISVKS